MEKYSAGNISLILLLFLTYKNDDRCLKKYVEKDYIYSVKKKSFKVLQKNSSFFFFSISSSRLPMKHLLTFLSAKRTREKENNLNIDEQE